VVAARAIAAAAQVAAVVAAAVVLVLVVKHLGEPKVDDLDHRVVALLALGVLEQKVLGLRDVGRDT
jgi:ABC-type uncharacterized transport system YnjBCD permease subunit